MNTTPVSTCPRPRLLLVALLSSLTPAILFAQATPVPPAIPATTRTAAEDAVQLNTFTVREDQDIGYESMHTTSGMRTVQELKNLANSISIINAQLIEDTASILDAILGPEE